MREHDGLVEAFDVRFGEFIDLWIGFEGNADAMRSVP